MLQYWKQFVLCMYANMSSKMKPQTTLLSDPFHKALLFRILMPPSFNSFIRWFSPGFNGRTWSKILFTLSHFSDILALLLARSGFHLEQTAKCSYFKPLTFKFLFYISSALLFWGNDSPRLLDQDRQPNGWVGFNFYASSIQTWFALSYGIIWYSV